MLLDDDIDTTVQARARMFLIVSYNLAVAQSRLKFYDDAIGSSGRHLKMVHAVLPSDDPIRRKLIDFRRHLAERVQQQMEECRLRLAPQRVFRPPNAERRSGAGAGRE